MDQIKTRPLGEAFILYQFVVPVSRQRHPFDPHSRQQPTEREEFVVRSEGKRCQFQLPLNRHSHAYVV